MKKQVVKNKSQLNSFLKAHLQKKRYYGFTSNEEIKPMHYPCIAVCNDKGDEQPIFISVPELLKLKIFPFPESEETSIIVLRIHDTRSQIIQGIIDVIEMIRKRGMDVILLDASDQIIAPSFEELINIMDKSGFSIIPKHQA